MKGASTTQTNQGKLKAAIAPLHVLATMGQPATYYRFILLPSLVGLICYACSQTTQIDRSSKDRNQRNQPQADQTVLSDQLALPSKPSAGAAPTTNGQTDTSPVANSSTTAKQSLDSQSKAFSRSFQEGINLASSAYQLSQSAISPDDWELVESKWTRAIEQLNQVGEQSDQYNTAQAKIEAYTRNAEYASSQVKALQASAKTPVEVQQQPASRQPPAYATEAAATLKPPTASQQSLAADRSSSKITPKRVPIVRRIHGTPVVRVTFNGSKTYDMILDTGASRTLITKAMANELEVVATERMIAATASASDVVFELGRVDSISMGDITLSNARVSIGDSIDVGLLGNDFFNGYDITIRGRENVIELVRS